MSLSEGVYILGLRCRIDCNINIILLLTSWPCVERCISVCIILCIVTIEKWIKKHDYDQNVSCLMLLYVILWLCWIFYNIDYCFWYITYKSISKTESLSKLTYCSQYFCLGLKDVGYWANVFWQVFCQISNLGQIFVLGVSEIIIVVSVITMIYMLKKIERQRRSLNFIRYNKPI